jgi:hypothetical protein
MYIVVTTIKPYKNNHVDVIDNWTAHETYDDAKKEYNHIITIDTTYSASIARVVESTDYII